jgi:glycerophosphoryl diester phosphodiesterase
LAGVYLKLLDLIGRERLLFGHRGVPQEAPENTLAGFRRALELGLDGVELDVRLCSSGEMVIFHDDDVSRLTNGSGRICELCFDELRRLDAGIRFEEKFQGEKIPSLEEVFELVGGRMLVNVELKTDSLRDQGLEAKVIALIEKMNLQSSIILSSFNPFSLWRAKQKGPDLVAALLFADDQPVHLRRAWATAIINVDGIHPRHPLITEKLMRKARSRKWFVGAWTVDAVARATRFFDIGVDIIISNRPAQLRQALAQERETRRP